MSVSLRYKNQLISIPVEVMKQSGLYVNMVSDIGPVSVIDIPETIDENIFKLVTDWLLGKMVYLIDIPVKTLLNACILGEYLQIDSLIKEIERIYTLAKNNFIYSHRGTWETWTDEQFRTGIKEVINKMTLAPDF